VTIGGVVVESVIDQSLMPLVAATAKDVGGLPALLYSVEMDVAIEEANGSFLLGVTSKVVISFRLDECLEGRKESTMGAEPPMGDSYSSRIDDVDRYNDHLYLSFSSKMTLLGMSVKKVPVSGALVRSCVDTNTNGKHSSSKLYLFPILMDYSRNVLGKDYVGKLSPWTLELWLHAQHTCPHPRPKGHLPLLWRGEELCPLFPNMPANAQLSLQALVNTPQCQVGLHCVSNNVSEQATSHGGNDHLPSTRFFFPSLLFDGLRPIDTHFFCLLLLVSNEKKNENPNQNQNSSSTAGCDSEVECLLQVDQGMFIPRSQEEGQSRPLSVISLHIPTPTPAMRRCRLLPPTFILTLLAHALATISTLMGDKYPWPHLTVLLVAGGAETESLPTLVTVANCVVLPLPLGTLGTLGSNDLWQVSSAWLRPLILPLICAYLPAPGHLLPSYLTDVVVECLMPPEEGAKGGQHYQSLPLRIASAWYVPSYSYPSVVSIVERLGPTHFCQALFELSQAFRSRNELSKDPEHFLQEQMPQHFARASQFTALAPEFQLLCADFERVTEGSLCSDLSFAQ
jgi:hypothetical protein